MKKFTSFLLMLLCAVTTWAQVVEGQMYRIMDNTRSKYLTIRSYNQTSNGAYGTVPVIEKSFASDDQVWYVESTGTENQYYLKSKSGYYLVCQGWCVDANNTGTKSVITISDAGDGSVHLLNGGSYFKVEDIPGDNGIAHPFCDAASGHSNIVTWTFETVDESEFNVAKVTVTYNFTYGGETKYTQENANVVDGAAYPAITQKFPYGVTATVPSETVDASTAVEGVITVEVPLTVSELPFVAAETAEGITNWYYMQMHWNNKHYVNANGTSIVWSATEVTEGSEDAFTWGFVGNIWDGFKVVNYAAYNEDGNDNTTLTWSGASSLGTFDAATQFPMVHTTWGGTPDGSFCLSIPGTTNYLNAQSSTVASWFDTDAGSTIWLTERPMTLNAELAFLIEEYEAMGITSGTNPGEYTVASVTAFNDALTTAKAVAAATQDDIDALTAAYEALAINPIEAGLYIIVNAKPAFADSKVLTTYGPGNGYVGASTPAWAEKNANDPLQYFEIEKVGENFYLKSAYEGSYVTSINTLGSEPAAATFDWKSPGQYNITIGGGVFHANLHGYDVSTSNIVGYGGDADSPSAWKLVKVEEPSFTHTLNVTDAGYATLMLGFNATIPTGVTCYVATGNDEADINLATITGVLPANTAVLVEATPGNYEFVSTESTSNVTSEFQGTLYNKNIEGVAYVLGIVDGKVGFYQAALDEADNTAFQNQANKIYYVIYAGSEAVQYFALNFGGGTTGIEGVEAEGAVSGKIYDITGREVKAITAPGIYIVNGKKVIK